MPRGSLRPEDGMKQGFGIQEGNIEVVSSLVVVHQFPPNSKTGKQSDPFTAIRWGVRKLNAEWEPEDEEAGLEEVFIRIGTPGDIRPGKVQDPADMDEEPEDLGSEVGTEGPAIYVESGKRLGNNWVRMAESLIKNGFKAEVIARSFLPDFDGMKLHVHTVETGKYKDRTGEEKMGTALVCDRIHVRPYEKATSKAKAGSAASKANGKAGEVAPASAEAMSPVDRLKWLIAEPSPTFKAVVGSDKAIKRAAFQQAVSRELMTRKVKIPEHKPLGDLLKDNDGIMEAGVECGFLVDVDAGTVQFGG